jgi:hypothetical protein
VSDARVASSGVAFLICVKCLDNRALFPKGYPVFLEDAKAHEYLPNCQAVTIADGQALCNLHYNESRNL